MMLKQHFEPPVRKKRKKDNGDVLDYNSSIGSQSWAVERDLADRIMDHVKKNNLNYKLDKLTRGQGNCFMIAVLQQLQQDHVYQCSSQQVKNLADNFSHMEFRQAVHDFIQQSSDPRLTNVKESFNVARAAGLMNDSWEQYWEAMLEPGTRADTYFVHAAAYPICFFSYVSLPPFMPCCHLRVRD